MSIIVEEGASVGMVSCEENQQGKEHAVHPYAHRAELR